MYNRIEHHRIIGINPAVLLIPHIFKTKYTREQLGKIFFIVNNTVSSGAVVYQKPKISAETESFQLSAFGFGRRK